MVSNKFFKKLSNLITYDLGHKNKEVSIEHISKIRKNLEHDIILQCIAKYSLKYIITERNGIKYIRYNKCEIVEENIECEIIKKTKEYICDDDLLKLSPLYVFSIRFDEYDKLVNHKIYNHANITMYPAPHKILDGVAHIYIQWSHMYLNNVKILKNTDGTLTFDSNYLDVMFNHVYSIVDNNNNKL
jgi:hypothetical protein